MVANRDRSSIDQKFIEEWRISPLNKGIWDFVVHVAVAVPVRAENGIDPDEERELIVCVGVLKTALAQTTGECQRPYVRGQSLLVSGFSLLFPHAASLTPLM